MLKSMLLANFWEQYGLWIILIVMLGIIMLFNMYKTRKLNENEANLMSKVVPGAKVKTYSGFYGIVEKITETTDGKVVTLKLSDNAFIDVDARAIYAIDEKKTIEEVELMEKLENVKNVETASINTQELDELNKPEEVKEVKEVKKKVENGEQDIKSLKTQPKEKKKTSKSTTTNK